MPEEVIFSVDMQSQYSPKFPGGYDLACNLCELFSEAAAECGVPTWYIYYGDRSRESVKYDQPMFNKHGSSAFSNPSLLSELRRQGVKRINVLGFALGDCVAATAIDAAQEKFEIVVVQDLAFGCPSDIEMRKANDYKERVLVALECYFSETIIPLYPAYVRAASDFSKQLFKQHIDRIREDSSVPLDKIREGLFVCDAAEELAFKAQVLGQLVIRMTRAEIMAEKRATRNPDYLALKSIGVETTEEILDRLRNVSRKLKLNGLIT